jgi:NAD-dependent SIR2 family protein deacetylase
MGKQVFQVESLSSSIARAEWYGAISRIKLNIIDGSEPSAAHWFIRTLDLKQKLRRLYSQNIDGLEIATGMVDARAVRKEGFKGGVVLLHGNIHVLRCERCCFRASWNTSTTKSLSVGVAPPCPDCQSRGESFRAFPSKDFSRIWL